MKRNQHTVPAPDVIRIPKPERPQRDKVFYADNSDSDWRNALIGLAAFAIGSVVVYFASGSLKFAVTLYLVLTGITVMAVMGILPTLWATALEAVTDLRWADVEKTRVEATRDVILAESQNVRELQQHQHAAPTQPLGRCGAPSAHQRQACRLRASSPRTGTHGSAQVHRPMLHIRRIQC